MGNNPFELFGLTPTFTIDEQQLATTYRSLQRVVHPDRYVGASDHERRQAVEQAATVNDAYKILRDPVRRADCLLSLLGHPENEQRLMDPAFLMEQMELRERLGEVHDSDHPLNTLAELTDLLRQRRATLLGELDDFLRNTTQESLAQAAEIVLRLRFFDRLVEEARLLEDRYLDLIPS